MQRPKTSETHPIRVDFVGTESFPMLNRLGMTFAPGKKQTDALSGVWDRDLKIDLERLFNEFGAGTLISLLEEQELDQLQIRDFAAECDRAMINLIRFPIRDVSVPDSIEDFVSMIAVAVNSLKHGETVLTHCKGGLGRAGLTAACIAVAATDVEISASEAIDIVRRARSPQAVETQEQEQFVAEFEKEWREVMANRGDHYLLYWQERSIQDHAANSVPLDVVASNQLINVCPGDVIWIVTLTQERALVLAGRLKVGEVVEYEEAMLRMPDSGLWQAEYYAFPEPETEEYLREVNIHHLAEDIRFDSENDRLILRDGKINPQQLQSLRKLTRQSVDLLDNAFNTVGPFAVDDLEPEAQVAFFRALVEFDPNDPMAHYNLGVALGNIDKIDESVAEFERTLEIDPAYFGAQFNLGNIFLRIGRCEAAVDALNKAILIDGEYPPAHFMLGAAYFACGRFDDAVAATRQGMEIDPDDESAHYNIAYWTFRHGDYRAALALCDDVIDRFPFFTSPHVLKGMCFRELGKPADEIQAYKDAIDIKVDDEGALVMNITAIFFLGAAWERQITSTDEGIEYVEVENLVNLDDPTHQFCFAMGHLAQGERQYADRWLPDLRSSAPELAHRLERVLND